MLLLSQDFIQKLLPKLLQIDHKKRMSDTNELLEHKWLWNQVKSLKTEN